MILVDSNVIMYAASDVARKRKRCLAFLERVALGEVDAALDVEAFQEILHRNRSINRWVDGKRVYTLARSVIPVVLPIDAETTDRALKLMDAHRSLGARDALHVAVVLVNGLDGICSFDRDFDKIPDLRRVEPE